MDDLRACRGYEYNNESQERARGGTGRVPSRAVPRANLIGSWILSSARNYYLRYKSGDLPRQPSRARRYYPRSHTRMNQPPPRTRTQPYKEERESEPTNERQMDKERERERETSTPKRIHIHRRINTIAVSSRNVRDYPQVLITNLASANYN